LDHSRVELSAAAALNLLAGRLLADPLPVGTRAHHRIIGIGNGNDPGDPRDLLAAQPLGIPLPVPSLMVEFHRPNRVFQAGNRKQFPLHSGFDLRVGLHDFALLRVQRRGLGKNILGHEKLPEIMQKSGTMNPRELVIRQGGLARLDAKE